MQLAGLRFVAAADAAPPHRLIGLRGFPLGDRVTDPRVKAPPPARTLGAPPDEIAAIAGQACAELGLAALVLAGGEPGREPWVVATGHADLDRAEPLDPGHRFPVPGVTGLVTGTAVLRLVAEGRLDLDTPANDRLRTVRLAGDAVTVRELLSHTGGVGNPAELYADSVPGLAALMGPVIACVGPRGTVWPSNGGYGVLGQLIADVTGQPYARAAARLVLDPLGMRDSRFPARAADIGPGAVTGYTVTADGVSNRSRPRSPRCRPSPGSGPPGPTWYAWAPGGRRCCPRRWPARPSPRRPDRDPAPSGSGSACSWNPAARPSRTAGPGSKPWRFCAAASATTGPTSC